MENFNTAAYIRQLKILYFAITGSPLAVMILVYLAFSQEKPSGTDEETILIFGSIGLIISLFAFLASFFVPKLLLSQMKTSLSLIQKLGLYRSYFIVKLALINMASLINIIFFVVTGHEIFLLIALGFIAANMLIVRPPVIEKIADILNLSQEEIAQLK